MNSFRKQALQQWGKAWIKKAKRHVPQHKGLIGFWSDPSRQARLPGDTEAHSYIQDFRRSGRVEWVTETRDCKIACYQVVEVGGERSPCEASIDTRELHDRTQRKKQRAELTKLFNKRCHYLVKYVKRIMHFHNWCSLLLDRGFGQPHEHLRQMSRRQQRLCRWRTQRLLRR